MKKLSMFVASVSLLAFGTASILSAAEYQETVVTNGGSIDATITFKGAASKEATIKVDKNPEVCGSGVPKEDLLVGPGGGLRNAVIYLADISQGKKGDPTAMTIGNSKCVFHPHVQAGVAGSKLTITNDDPVLHNTHIFLIDQKTRRTVFNKGLPNKGMSLTDDRALRKEGLYNVKCDAHSFMSGWVVTLPHPYHAVTGPEGKAKLSDVPPGEYNLVVWHETLPEKQQKVKVEAGKATAVDVTFSK